MGLSLMLVSLSVLIFFGSWTYTGPEHVTCTGSNLTCSAPLVQLQVSVFNSVQAACLALVAAYPAVALLDPRPFYRWWGSVSVVVVSAVTVFWLVTPAPTVALDAGGFIFPIPTLTAAGATAMLVLSAALVFSGLVPRSTQRRRRPRRLTPAEVVAQIVKEADETNTEAA